MEQGFTEKLLADINMAAGNPVYDESLPRGVQEATGSNHDLDYQFVDQASSPKITFFKEYFFISVLCNY